MSSITVFAISSIIAFFLVFVGAFLNQNKKSNDYGNYFNLTGYVLILIVGLYILVNPLTMIVEENRLIVNEFGNDNTTVISSSENVEYVRDSVDEVINYSLSMVYILLGLGGVIMSFLKIREDRWRAIENGI